jgi:hypothetical protein
MKRALALAALAALAAGLCWGQRGKEDPERKLTEEEKIELLRGLSAEYATVKAYLPRSKKALRINSDGTWDKAEWSEMGQDYGPVARTGDQVQVTKVEIESDRIVFEINGGLRTRGKWHERVEGGVGGGGRQQRPLSRNLTLAFGTTIALHFPGRVPPVKPAEVKGMLKGVLDFDKRSATDNYFESMPKEIQEAIKANRAEVGMTRDQVLMAVGHPRDRIRETKDGEEFEDWIYGLPPGKITFVTFNGGKVVKVKDAFAGLGGSTAPPLKAP